MLKTNNVYSFCDAKKARDEASQGKYELTMDCLDEMREEVSLAKWRTSMKLLNDEAITEEHSFLRIDLLINMVFVVAIVSLTMMAAWYMGVFMGVGILSVSLCLFPVYYVSLILKKMVFKRAKIRAIGFLLGSESAINRLNTRLAKIAFFDYLKGAMSYVPESTKLGMVSIFNCLLMFVASILVMSESTSMARLPSWFGLFCLALGGVTLFVSLLYFAIRAQKTSGNYVDCVIKTAADEALESLDYHDNEYEICSSGPLQ